MFSNPDTLFWQPGQHRYNVYSAAVARACPFFVLVLRVVRSLSRSERQSPTSVHGGVQISPYERVVLRSLEPTRSQRTSTSPSPQYHDMIAGRPASVLSGGGDDATMYALGVLKWWRVAPRPALSSLLF